MLAVWRQYPKQIEVGLRGHYSGVSIRQWHAGDLSSRELLALVEGLPHDSWFKQAVVRDLAAQKVAAERAEMMAAHTEIESYLRGQARIPHEMTVAVVDKRTPMEGGVPAWLR